MGEQGESICDHLTQPSLLQQSAEQRNHPASSLHCSVHQTISSSQNSSGICLSNGDCLDNTRLSQSALSLSTTDPSLFSSLCDSRVGEEPWADIELISLTGQQGTRLPRYRLRVDPCTAFLGYKHKDFSGAKRATRRPRTDQSVPKSPSELTTLRSPDTLTEDEDAASDCQASDDETSSLTTEQIEHTLDYFLLCGLRVSQMARTYEDLEAITHLLEEKQNDLELAAKIGKNLLDKNNELERRLSDTEKKLTASEDTVSQLRHNLAIKDNLLQIYSRDHVDESGDDGTTVSSGWISPPNGTDHRSDSGAANLSFPPINFAHLNRKVRELEEENFILREERNRLTTTADQLDEHETALIRDCARQLVSANMHIRTLSDELAKKSDAFLNQQSEVTRLLTRGLDLESRVKQLAAENEMLVNRLQESQANQQRLANELTSLRDKYDECLSLYSEARSEVRALRKRSRRAHLRSGYLSSPGTMTSYSTPPHLSLLTQTDSTTLSCPAYAQGSDGSSSSLDATTNSTANDLLGETSLASDLARTAAKDSATSNVDRLFRAMDQARHVRGGTDAELRDNPGRPNDSAHEDTVSSSGFVSGSEPSEMLPRLTGYQTSDTQMNNNQPDRRPSSPLSFRPWCRHDSLEEQLKRHSWLGCEVRKGSLSDDPALSQLFPRNTSDDNLLSSDPTVVYGQSYSRIPQRLQLIKPLDGSEVLQHWQRLATPSFTNALFEAPLPGVRSRAGVDTAGSDTAPLGKRLGAVGPNGSSPALCRLADCTSPETPMSSKTDPRASRQTAASRELAHRFGLSSPSQLLGSSLRSRSVEHLQHFVRQPNQQGVISRQSRLPPPVAQSDSSGTTPFSLTSLVSSLLPFSLSPISTPPSETPTRKEATPEPIRIRPRSPPGSRGLLDVTGTASDPPTLQRAATAARGASPSPIQLPSAQPPPVATHVFPRTPYTRTHHNPSLSGITEESGSPPKRDVSSEPSTNPVSVDHEDNALRT